MPYATLRREPAIRVAGVEFVVAREPHEGIQLAPPGCPVWFIAADPADRAIGVYYTFSANEVLLISITQQPAH